MAPGARGRQHHSAEPVSATGWGPRHVLADDAGPGGANRGQRIGGGSRAGPLLLQSLAELQHGVMVPASIRSGHPANRAGSSVAVRKACRSSDRSRNPPARSASSSSTSSSSRIEHHRYERAWSRIGQP